ncbi:MAG: hypothetical protein GXP55_22895 [Deltaproteobacteria bacterium]|nr:hypothetical protein [Deltaproteobacteria bacterium]
MKALAIGLVLLGVAQGTHHFELGPGWLFATLLAIGGLLVVFGSCEAMILSVEGMGERAGWNGFVAGTMAGLASNLPEVVMLGFVLVAAPRIGFIVVILTLHVGALAFGVYSGLLPHDKRGFARLPEPLVKLSTDLYAAAAGVFLATGLLMLCLRAFSAGAHEGLGLGPTDLYVISAVLLAIEVVAIVRLVKRFSGASGERAADGDLEQMDGYKAPKQEEPPHDPPTTAHIAGFGILGVITSVIGGHAVGEFADILVRGVEAAGYPEMIGAILLSVFSCTGAYVMIATAHAKGLYDIALANVSGAITQVPFVVMPISLILIGVFVQFGVVPAAPGGSALPIDLETTMVMLLAFPELLILWKAVQDDGKLNWVETAGMCGIFSLTLYFLAMHG